MTEEVKPTEGVTNVNPAKPEGSPDASILFDDLVPAAGEQGAASARIDTDPSAHFLSPALTEQPADSKPAEGESKADAKPGAGEPAKGEKSSGLLKLKIGDKEHEVDPKTVIVPTPVDGKEEAPSLEDLKVNYSGKVAWGKKFEELAKERKKFDQNLGIVNNQMQRWAELIQAGKGKDFIDDVLVTIKQNPIKFWNDLKMNIAPEAAKYMNLSEEQKQSLHAQGELEALREENKRLKGERETSTSQAQLASQVKSILDREGLTQEDVDAAWQDVVQASKQGQLSAEELEFLQKGRTLDRLQYTINRIGIRRAVDRVTKIVDEVDPALAQNDDCLKELFALAANKAAGVSDERLKRIAQTYIDKGSEKVTSKSGTAPAAKESTPAQPEERYVRKEVRPESVLWDDI